MLYNVSIIDLSNTAAKCKASNYVLLANVSKTLFSIYMLFYFLIDLKEKNLFRAEWTPRIPMETWFNGVKEKKIYFDFEASCAFLRRHVKEK